MTVNYEKMLRLIIYKSDSPRTVKQGASISVP